MTENEIKFNYNKAMEQASELKDISKKLKEMSTDSLQDCYTKINKNWDGDNSQSYLKNVQKVQKKINGSASNINSAATAIETMAKTIYDAEMAALALIRQREYEASLKNKNVNA